MRFLILFLWLYPLLSQAEVHPRSLADAVHERLAQVDEFAFIIEEASKLGVKVYLFGGTASAFAHYVRWDLERETGDPKYQKERFDYDFTNIYRGNQDLDIVVDGTEQQALKLQRILQKTYPHFVGKKEAWEVRLLKEKMGDKLPLLGDDDFKNQHTDSNSTGLIDLTALESENVFKDLLSWDNVEASDFLNDVASGTIQYFFSDKHETTQRFQARQNPPLLSAIRYIAKLTQYEVKGSDKDLATVKKIITKTNFSELSSYAKHKASEFGLKALLNAPNIEFAMNLLEETGLKKRLIKMDGNRINIQNTLSWWLNKKPLTSFKVGIGRGKTARELNIDIVAHETKNFIAYENITRSTKGQANVFISRNGINGEVAALGDGFYTRKGQIGAVGSGITIRFHLHPEAREGTDFKVVSKDYILILNKKALRLIQEDLNISEINYYKLLLNGQLSEYDQGLREKLKRKFSRKTGRSETEAKEIYELLMKNVPKYNFSTSRSDVLISILDTWFSHPDSVKYPKLYKYVLRQANSTFNNRASVKKWMIQHIFSHKHWVKEGERQISRWIPHKRGENFVGQIYDTITFNRAKCVDACDNDYWMSLIEHIFSKPYWNHKAEWLEVFFDFISPGTRSVQLLSEILSQDHWKERPDLFLELIKKGQGSPLSILFQITTIDRLKNNLDFILTFINTFSDSHKSEVMALINFLNVDGPPEVIKAIIDHEHSINSWINPEATRYTWSTLQILDFLNKKNHNNWHRFPRLLTHLTTKGGRNLKPIVPFLEENPQWAQDPQVYENLMKQRGLLKDLFVSFVRTKIWEKHAYLFEMVLKKLRYHKISTNFKIKNLDKKEFTTLQELTGLENPRYKNLRQMIEANPFGQWAKTWKRKHTCEGLLSW